MTCRSYILGKCLLKPYLSCICLETTSVCIDAFISFLKTSNELCFSPNYHPNVSSLTGYSSDVKTSNRTSILSRGLGELPGLKSGSANAPCGQPIIDRQLASINRKSVIPIISLTHHWQTPFASNPR